MFVVHCKTLRAQFHILFPFKNSMFLCTCMTICDLKRHISETIIGLVSEIKGFGSSIFSHIPLVESSLTGSNSETSKKQTPHVCFTNLLNTIKIIWLVWVKWVYRPFKVTAWKSDQRPLWIMFKWKKKSDMLSGVKWFTH